MTSLLRRISWSAVMSVVCMLASLIVVIAGHSDVALVIALSAIAWAMLSLKDLSA